MSKSAKVELLSFSWASQFTVHALFKSLAFICQVTWGFIESDFFTFAIPNTLFGIIGALAASSLIHGPPPLAIDVLQRSPLVLVFNFISLLMFDLSNQRSLESVEEDRINKPWRPIPSGQVTPEQTRKVMLLTAPFVLGFYYLLGISKQGLLVQFLSWYYNDLKGGDEVFRDAIIAASYGLANVTSLRLAVGSESAVSQHGYVWISMVSAVILTTMHIQDLKDQEGDHIRGRKTVPLVLGDRTARFAIAVSVPFWSYACASFWRLSYGLYPLPTVLGLLVALRVLTKRSPLEDRRTWRLWCLWHASLYPLPLLSNLN